jgi:hypothetical protein
MQMLQELGRDIQRNHTQPRRRSRAERLLPPRERDGGLERDRGLEIPRRTRW